MIKKPSQFDVETTLDRLETIIKEKGLKLIARVNHGAAAKSVDLELRPTQVLLFGNPALGTSLMQSDQLAGLELPMRVLAWQDEAGDTWLAYHAPQTLANELALDGVDETITKMTGAMDALTQFATTE